MPLLNKNKNELGEKEAKDKKTSKKIIAITLGGVLLVGGLGYTYTNTIKAKNEVNSEMVSREREYLVEKGDIVAGINSTGKIKFKQNTQNVEESVTIKEVYVKVGQRIRKGDKIVSLSTTNKGEKIIYANASGIVYDLGYSAGDKTSIEIPLITIAEEGDVFAEIPVSQDDILNIEEGQQIYIWVSAYEGVKFSGKVDFINLKPSSESGTSNFSVTVKLDESDYELLDGMSISSQFIFKELKDVLTLSNKAITLKDGKQMVRVRQEDGTLKEKAITTGFSDGKKSEIISGLKEGDIVVVGGQ